MSIAEYPAAHAVVDEGSIYVDRNLATASWWEKYRLVGGTYPVEYVTIDHRPVNVAEGGRPYYAIVRVPAVMIESYYVSRLFNASSAHHETGLEKESVRIFEVYAYNVIREPALVVEDDPTPENKWNRKVTARIVLD